MKKIIKSESNLPTNNFSNGLYVVDSIPNLLKIYSGKVRDIFVTTERKSLFIVTTDRLSAFDHIICTVPNKGAVLNLLTQWWCEQTVDIIPNHLIAVPHPNAMFTKPLKMIPVEFVVRGYLSRSSSQTSLWNYYSKHKDNPYGIELPDSLDANRELPQLIITPTTKAGNGLHDLALTYKQAKKLVDDQFGNGTYDNTCNSALKIFKRASNILLQKGILLADTKFEFGIAGDSVITLADEVITPDNSRLWLLATYDEALSHNEDPKDFSKEPFRKWLAAHGYTGNEPIPEIPTSVINAVAKSYTDFYRLLTGRTLPGRIKSTAKLLKELRSASSNIIMRGL